MLVTDFVSETPGINGGYPVVAGTRTPIWVLVDYYRELGDVQRVAQLLPHLTPTQVQGALDYYAACPHRVDDDRERNARAWIAFTGQPWPDQASASRPTK
jgi:uncharacterized protein (DUF433 family)